MVWFIISPVLAPSATMDGFKKLNPDLDYKIVKMVDVEIDIKDNIESAIVFSRPECVFEYCPHPKMCKDKCLNV